MHLDPFLTGPFAGLAPAAGLIEAEPASRITPHLRLGELGKELSNQVEHTGIGRGSRAGSAAQRRLVNADDFINVLQPLDRLVSTGSQLSAVQGTRGRFPEDVFHQRALARPRDARDDGHHGERESNIEVPEIMLPRPLDHNRLAASIRRRPAGDWLVRGSRPCHLSKSRSAIGTTP